VIFGGVGTGLYSILLYVLLAVFLGGLMVGRTPEYIGKKIGPRRSSSSRSDPDNAAGGAVSTALATASAAGRASIDRRHGLGPQAFGTFYAYLSQANNRLGLRRSPASSSPTPHSVRTGSPSRTCSAVSPRCSRGTHRSCSRSRLASTGEQTCESAGLGTMRTTTHIRSAVDRRDHPRRRTHLLPALLLGPIVQA